MPPGIGRLTNVGLGKETVRGTAVAPSIWTPHQEFTVEDRDEKLMDDSALGTIHKNWHGDQDYQWAEGAMGGFIYDRSIGFLLLAAFGEVDSDDNADASGDVYEHDFSVANNNTHPSLTIAAKDPNEDVRIALAMLSSLEITAEVGSYIRYTAEFLGKKSVSASNTVAITNQNRFRPQDFELKIADTPAGFGDANPVVVRNFTIRFEKNTEVERGLGSADIAENFNRVFETTVSFNKLYANTTFKDFVFSGGQKAMQVSMVNSGVTIGTAANPSLRFVFQPGFFSSWGKEGGLDDIRSENVEFMGLYSTSESEEVTAHLTNLQETY